MIKLLVEVMIEQQNCGRQTQVFYDLSIYFEYLEKNLIKMHVIQFRTSLTLTNFKNVSKCAIAVPLKGAPNIQKIFLSPRTTYAKHKKHKKLSFSMIFYGGSH